MFELWILRQFRSFTILLSPQFQLCDSGFSQSINQFLTDLSAAHIPELFEELSKINFFFHVGKFRVDNLKLSSVGNNK